MTEEIEIWKPIPGYEAWYDISNFGNVRSYHINNSSGLANRKLEPKIMTPNITDYVYVGLSRGIGFQKMKAVHILVATMFIDNPLKLKWVHHKDDDKHNPHYSNLEWTTPSQNQIYSYQNGRRERPIGESNGRCVLSKEQALEIFTSTENHYKLASEYGVARGTISNIKNGKIWGKLTGKKFCPKKKRIIEEQDILDILKDERNHGVLALKYNVSRSVISGIKTGRCYSDITKVKFKGKREYDYYGQKSTLKKAS